jgi:hemoglobin
MSFSKSMKGALLAALAATVACDQTGQVGGARTPPGAAPAGNGGVVNDALYLRLGQSTGIRTLMVEFVNRVAADPRINSYFLNKGVDPGRIIECLTLQLSTATGGPYQYPGSTNCRSMRDVHTGLNISQQDFDDTAGHLVGALQKYGVQQADIQTLVTAVGATSRDIVADINNQGTLYSRLGRRPGIEGVIVKFLEVVFADQRINAFFAGASVDQANRVRTCLARMVCQAAAGPCKYGLEVDGESGVSANAPCRDMVAVHQNLKPRPITIEDFNALVEDLVKVLDSFRVPGPDKMAILGALGPTCRQIVAGGTGCP